MNAQRERERGEENSVFRMRKRYDYRKVSTFPRKFEMNNRSIEKNNNLALMFVF